ncbi:MAG: DoxX family protein [Cellvibrio sp.]|uniref:DoxX family protein n=1 Tax=Cellvibrio sp. TaxID=1965322 RepID=UPI0027188125|nr:DoxX family protein [Cellvibrio sp.]
MNISSYYHLEQKLKPVLGIGEVLFNVIIRLYIAQIFFRSGLTKLRDWDSTLFLFEEEYHVPLLSSDAAAYLGTGGEIVLPVLLALGLFTRFAASGLFVVNLVAAMSLADLSAIAWLQHAIWGTGAMYIMLHGGAHFSVDYLLKKLWLK